MLVFRESSGRSLCRAPFVRRARRRGGNSNGSPTGRSGIFNDHPRWPSRPPPANDAGKTQDIGAPGS